MEKLYNDFKDVAEFRLVYIREAHAADGPRPNSVSRSLGITEHDTFEERCDTAKKLIDDKSLTIPTLIDDIKNSVDTAYSAKPDRIYLVRSDGRLGIAGDRGPNGFAPALANCRTWLMGLEALGEEPALTAKQEAAGAAKDAQSKSQTQE